MTGIGYPRRAVLKALSATAILPAVAATARSDWDGVSHLLGDADESAWIRANVPFFDCPDAEIREIYYFRWRSFRRSLKRSPDGWVVWEFPYHVPWAGLHNTIVDAAAHHILEGRWLRDPQPMRDDLRFWLTNPNAPLRGFSCWIATAALGLNRVHPDEAFAAAMLQPLVHNYHAWEDVFRDSSGLYTQMAVNDGMEEAASGPQGLRPTLNSYQYGDARAIAAFARGFGMAALADAYDARAAALKTLVETRLWNPATGFFDTIRHADGALSGERELVGYLPWYFDLPDARFASAWAHLIDPQGFSAPFGPTTLERRSKGFELTDNDSRWNGSSWPYATSQTLVALANLIARGDPAPVDRTTYLDLLGTYARSQYRTLDGHRVPWIGESLQPLTGRWTSETRGYNHSTYADLIVTGLCGLRPRADATIEIDPMLPAGAWDHFALRGVRYRGHDVAIVWDRTGKRHGHGAGLTLLVDGRIAARRATPGRLTARLPDVPSPVAAPEIHDAIGPGRVSKPTVTASFWKAESPVAVIDGDSDADALWDYYGSGLATDWLQVTLPGPTRIGAIAWDCYEDEVRHKPPLRAAVHYWDGHGWQPVADAEASPAVPAAGLNRIRFRTVETDRFRLLVDSRKPGRHGVGGGITAIRWTSAAEPQGADT